MNRDRYNSLTQGLLYAAGFDLSAGVIVLAFHAYPDCLVVTVLADEDEDNAYIFDDQPEFLVKDVTVTLTPSLTSDYRVKTPGI